MNVIICVLINVSCLFNKPIRHGMDDVVDDIFQQDIEFVTRAIPAYILNKSLGDNIVSSVNSYFNRQLLTK
jgi:hypothetical protein